MQRYKPGLGDNQYVGMQMDSLGPYVLYSDAQAEIEAREARWEYKEVMKLEADLTAAREEITRLNRVVSASMLSIRQNSEEIGMKCAELEEQRDKLTATVNELIDHLHERGIDISKLTAKNKRFKEALAMIANHEYGAPGIAEAALKEVDNGV